MKKFVTIVAIVGVFVMLFGVPSAFAKATHESYSTGWTAVEGQGFNNCNGEWYAYTGKFLSTIQVTVDASGGLHYSEILRLHVLAEGLNTGAQYIDATGYYFGQNVTVVGANDFTFAIKFNLVSLDPNVPDLRGIYLIHQTLDANGNLTANIELDTVLDCQ